MADALGVPLSSYSRYENERYFKRPYLPIEFVRKLAPILADRGIDPAQIMALAGVSRDEAAPDVKTIETRAPDVQFVQMAVAMPSAAALKSMFEIMLNAFDELPPKAELAQALALRLPVALAQSQGPMRIEPMEEGLAHEEAAPLPSTVRLEHQPRPHI